MWSCLGTPISFTHWDSTTVPEGGGFQLLSVQGQEYGHVSGVTTVAPCSHPPGTTWTPASNQWGWALPGSGLCFLACTDGNTRAPAMPAKAPTKGCVWKMVQTPCVIMSVLTGSLLTHCRGTCILHPWGFQCRWIWKDRKPGFTASGTVSHFHLLTGLFSGETEPFSL